MVILTVAFPLEGLVKRLCRASLAQFLADSQASPGGVSPAFLFTETADPAGSRVIRAMAAQRVMNLIDEPQGKLAEFIITCQALEFQKVADRVGVCP